MCHLRTIFGFIVGFTCNACSQLSEPVNENPIAAEYSKPERMVDDSGYVVCDREFGLSSLSPYVLPYPVGKSYWMTQSPCFENGGQAHQLAYDFRMNMGEVMTASRSGEVILTIDSFCDNDHAIGHNNRIFIEHNDGSIGTYAHFRQYTVIPSIGDTVKQGDTIGHCGNSGNSSYPHLHMQLFYDYSTVHDTKTISYNFHNADAPLDANNALIMDEWYQARPY